ncbi:glycosyltransferase [Candidatus Saccharibacteria bacterium]|nr:glycosyltransferase [Candidatus Saccharibacteria bacterium]
MRKQPLVSVIIPAYNAAQFLPETIESALKQTYKNIEVIVVDDGSTDNTEEVVKKYPVRYIKIEHSGGPATPRNEGVHKAKGELVAFLDSDDVWLSKKLEKQVDFLRKRDFDFVSCDAVIIDEDGKKLRKSYLGGRKIPEGEVFSSLYQDNFIITSATLARKTVLIDAGLFDSSVNLVGVEDYDLWLRVAAKSRFGFHPGQLVLYRERSTSLSEVASTADLGKLLRVLQKNSGLAKRLMGPAYKARLFELFWPLMVAGVRDKSLRRGVKYFLLCLRYSPVLTANRIIKTVSKRFVGENKQ